MEYDPERGQRCTECFDMRMERTALYAYEHGFDAVATTNATSRWKDANQVDGSGYRAVEPYSDKLVYWRYNWQSDEMTLRKYQVGDFLYIRTCFLLLGAIFNFEFANEYEMIPYSLFCIMTLCVADLKI